MRGDNPDTLVWLPVSNAAGETIPAFAAMRVTGVDSDGVFTVAKPNADSAVTNIMFNGPVEIESGLYGQGTFGIPCSARYDTADGTPANGDEWGVENAGWKLKNAKLGFKIQGATDSSNGVATVVRNLDAAAAGGGLDLSGRSGSVADVTAAQFLRTTVSGTAGATVITPDDATETLPGDWKAAATQTLAGGKTINRYAALTGPVLAIGNNGEGSTTDPSLYAEGGFLIGNAPTGYNPAEALALYYDEATGFSLIQHADSTGGTSIDMREALAGVSASGGVVSIGGTAPTFYCRVIQASLRFKVGAGAGADGVTATDAIGNGFTGGILTTGSGANLATGGSVAFTGDISPSQLTANTDNWNPSGW